MLKAARVCTADSSHIRYYRIISASVYSSKYQFHASCIQNTSWSRRNRRFRNDASAFTSVPFRSGNFSAERTIVPIGSSKSFVFSRRPIEFYALPRQIFNTIRLTAFKYAVENSSLAQTFHLCDVNGNTLFLVRLLFQLIILCLRCATEMPRRP